MPLSAVIQLEAESEARIDQFTGRGVHGFWFKRWREVDEALGDELHAATQEAPFTLSPLMGLPKPGRDGVTVVHAGAKAWFRLAVLTDALAEATRQKWLTSLDGGSRITVPEERAARGGNVPGAQWKTAAYSIEEADYTEMARRHLMNSNPPRQWKLEFSTPTTFHGKTSHLPFPLPESLVGSWLRRWQAFAPVALPAEELKEWTRSHLAVSSFNLRTLPAREGEHLRVGCVGALTLRALDMPPYLRAAVDLLASFSSFCGSGSHTSQGLGLTKCWGREGGEK
jgi:CRISPR-associated endoribonuclease Cas6